jgi:myo-inositol-1(or 4)-monophosphatase
MGTGQEPTRQPAPGALLADAVAIARRAGALIARRFPTPFAVEHKGPVDLVTEIDRASQELIAREIRRRRPGHGILGEEGLDEPGDGGVLWVVDPIDGTTNFVHRFPVFAVSIGVYRGDQALAGVVFNPISKELFTASAGGGARLNGRPIKVSAVSALDQSLLGTGFPYGIREERENNLAHFSAMAVRVQGVRRCGAASLDLCWVACGRLDGFWELSLKPWDIAAGALIVREAGGRVTDFSDTEPGLDGSRTLASNGLLHSAMAKVLLASKT